MRYAIFRRGFFDDPQQRSKHRTKSKGVYFIVRAAFVFGRLDASKQNKKVLNKGEGGGYVVH